MKEKDLEAVMGSAWAAVAERTLGDSTSPRGVALGNLHAALCRADPSAVYKPGAPQVPGIDLEETQDIPLRDSPRLRPLPHESGNAT